MHKKQAYKHRTLAFTSYKSAQFQAPDVCTYIAQERSIAHARNTCIPSCKSAYMRASKIRVFHPSATHRTHMQGREQRCRDWVSLFHVTVRLFSLVLSP